MTNKSKLSSFDFINKDLLYWPFSTEQLKLSFQKLLEHKTELL